LIRSGDGLEWTNAFASLAVVSTLIPVHLQVVHMDATQFSKTNSKAINFEGLEPNPCTRTFGYRYIKRLLDLVFASLLIISLSPVLLVTAILVKLSSPGPILYWYRVVGMHGKAFYSCKFRSMQKEAESLKSKLSKLNEMSGPVFKIKNDPRITPLGKVLRKYSIDELPQLFIVLKGDMSLVGPRPPGMHEFVEFEQYQRRKASIKPGITCLWQVSGRNAIKDFDEWVRLDLEYIDCCHSGGGHYAFISREII